MTVQTPSQLLNAIGSEVIEALKTGHKTEIKLAKCLGHSVTFVVWACRKLKDDGEITLANKRWQLVNRTARVDPSPFMRPSPEHIKAKKNVGWFG